MRRRPLLFALPLAALAPPARAAHVPPGRAALAPPDVQAAPPATDALHFPADFGAHPQTRTEWWYITGSLAADTRTWGFQVTFFRSATGIDAAASAGRFAPAQIIFAHAALTDLEQHRLRHDQRIARSGFDIAAAATGDTRVVLRDWQLTRSATPASRYQASVTSDTAGFAFALRFDATQPVLLQGRGGLSRKGPGPDETSHYYSEPQLATSGTLTLDGRPIAVTGKAWLDHEWSDAFIPQGAVGWDWIGMNLDDGSTLTAFRLRRADGTSLYAGGSFRRPGGGVDDFPAASVSFVPGRVWESPSSRARYPVEWQVETPAGRYAVRARLDAQELDSRSSTGAIYWEGLSALFDAAGRRVGGGYLEMTGYATRLKL